jgi:hypothetical protein
LICPYVILNDDIYLSGLWEEFTAFRIQHESRRLYPGYAANDPDFSMPLAA